MTSVPAAPAATAQTTRERLVAAAFLAAAGVLLAVVVPVDGTARLGLDLAGDPSAGADVPVAAVGALAALVCMVAAWMQWRAPRSTALTAVVVGVLVAALVVAAAAGQSMNVAGLLRSTVLRATPLVLGGLGGLLCERAGVINIAIEGQLLAAAFVGAVVGSLAGASWGIAAGMTVGVAMALLLGVLSQRFRADQLIVGIILVVLTGGLTGFLNGRLLRPDPTLNSPGLVADLAIPGLSQLPLIGDALFATSPFVYAAIALVVVSQWALTATRWGLRSRAVGEHPAAADTAGVPVVRTRYRSLVFGGAVAGLGGAYFTLGSVGSFSPHMTGGRGFIALAAVIVGRWQPRGVLLAALLFGFADALQASLAILAVPLPGEVLLMAPYLATIVVVASVVHRVMPPAAAGRRYPDR